MSATPASPQFVRRRGGSVPPPMSARSMTKSPTMNTAVVYSSTPRSPTSPHYELGAKLLGTHSARKKAEQEVALMANRIAHLEAEREKARKKVEETRLRAQEILEAKARNEAILQAKREAEAKAAAELALEKEKQRAIRVERMNKLKAAREALAEKRRQEFVNAKTEEYERKELINSDRRSLMEKKTQLRAEIRAGKDQFRSTRMLEQSLRDQQLMESMLHRTEQEQVEFLRARQLAEEFERKERELLIDLKSAMTEQRHAFTELQQVLQKR